MTANGCPSCRRPGLFFIDKWSMNAIGQEAAIKAMARDLPMPPMLRMAALFCWPMVRGIWGSRPQEVLRNGAAIFKAGPDGWCGLAAPMLIATQAHFQDALKRGVHTFYQASTGTYVSAQEAAALVPA
jgi:hypothetical protein